MEREREGEMEREREVGMRDEREPADQKYTPLSVQYNYNVTVSLVGHLRVLVIRMDV